MRLIVIGESAASCLERVGTHARGVGCLSQRKAQRWPSESEHAKDGDAGGCCFRGQGTLISETYHPIETCATGFADSCPCPTEQRMGKPVICELAVGL